MIWAIYTASYCVCVRLQQKKEHIYSLLIKISANENKLICWKRQKKTSESFSLDNEVVTKTNSLPIRRKPFHFICFNLGEIERVTDCGATDFNICASRWVFFLSRSLLLLMCNVIMLTIYLNARNSFDIYIRCVCCYAYLHLVLKFEPYM